MISASRLHYLEKYKYIIYLLLICALGFTLRIYRLDSRSVWVDETFSLFEPTGHGNDIENLLNSEGAREIKISTYLLSYRYRSFLEYDANKGLKDVAVSLLKTDTQPPLYFFIMHFWIRYFGDTLFSIRLFSVLFGIISIICAFLFTSAIFDKKAGLFAAIFLAFSPFAVFYSQEARHYSLILSIALLSSYFLVRFQKDDRDIFPVGFIITSALGLYAHYFYIFILFAHIVYFLFFSGSGTKKRNKFCIAFLISLTLFLPWMFLVLLFGYNFRLMEWVFGYPNSIVIISKWIIYNLFSLFFITSYKNMSVLIVFNYLGIICLLFLIRVLLKPGKRLVFPGMIFLLTILCMVAIDLIEKGQILLHSRYYTFALVGLIPIIGYMFSANWAHKIYRPLIILIFMALSANSFFLAKGYAWHNVSSPRPKEACLWLNQQAKDKKTVVVLGNQRASVIPAVFYLDGNIIVAPVGSAGQLGNVFKHFRGSVGQIFVIQFIFENIIGENIGGWLGEAEYYGFKVKEKREFKDDYVIVTKFI